VFAGDRILSSRSLKVLLPLSAMAFNAATQVVRSVLSNTTHGLPTKDIYRRALKAADVPKMSKFTPHSVVLFNRKANGTLDSTSRSVNEGKPVPKVPNPHHPIRSMTCVAFVA
jgi:hypothetical protein